ncbi:MAG: orotidine-5'-phosphate decarboxylase, partial [Planctomycetes bacterium]|nr:orotidine-5'-phosphate decarboxylase [Planctomycetota bacterium]
MADTSFADRLVVASRAKRSQVVVGLDPRPEMMPSALMEEAVENRGRTAEAVGLAFGRFNLGIIEAVRDHAVAVKPQIAFYERFGRAGLNAYVQTLEAARESGLLVIGDVKRNDIGSTAAAYARGHLFGEEEGEGWLGGLDFRVDAITINPLFGYDGVSPFLERAAEGGGGIFALVKTSNPSSTELQDLETPEGLVYEKLADYVAEWGKPYCGENGYSLLGAVVGATFPEELESLRTRMPRTIFLVPGFGAQGGGVSDVVGAFDEEGDGAVVNSSRGIIYAFRREPYSEKYGPAQWAQAAGEACREMKEQIWEATH